MILHVCVFNSAFIGSMAVRRVQMHTWIIVDLPLATIDMREFYCNVVWDSAPCFAVAFEQ